MQSLYQKMGQKSVKSSVFSLLSRHYLEIPQSAVAERMEISIEVLHSLLYRARKWIRKKFGVEYEEFFGAVNETGVKTTPVQLILVVI